MADETPEIPVGTTAESGETLPPAEGNVSVATSQNDDLTGQTSQSELVAEDVTSAVEEIAPTSNAAGQFCCGFVANMNPQVRDLIYWRNPVKSGIFLGGSLAVMAMMCCNGFVNTLAFFGLIVLSLSFVVTAVGSVAKRFLGKDIPNPLRLALEQPFEVPEDKVRDFAKCAANCCQRACTELRRLYCIVDIPDSFKFGIALWLVYYITSRIGFFSLLILGDILLFSMPKIYEVYQVQIDQAVATGKKQAQVYLEKARTMPYVDQVTKVLAPKEKQT